MSIQFGDILQHNNLLYPIVDINDVKGGLRSIATFSSPALVSEYASIPEKYRSGYSLLLETSTGTIYYLAGVDPTNVSHWSPVGIGGNGYGVTNTIPKWTSSSILGNSNITDNGDTITINGNLMVIGTTSTVSSENLLVKDPIILLAGSQSGTPTYDAGLFVNRGSSDTQAFIWDESETEFKFITTTSGATVSGDVTIGTYSSVRTGVLSVGTGSRVNSRFIVSSSGGTVSLVVDEFGNVYNNGNGGIATNTAFGASALSITTGYNNTAIGVNTLLSNTSGVRNTAIGSESLILNIAGSNNTALGAFALYNSGASDNTAIGSRTLTNNTTGYANTAIGANTLLLNTTGHANTSIGYQSLYSNNGNRNTAVGNVSLYSNTNGVDNVAVGSISLYSNTTGSQNTAIGAQSLYLNKTGSSNTVLGYNSLFKNITGFNNTAVGVNSLYNNTSGAFLSNFFTAGVGYVDGTYTNVQLVYATGSNSFIDEPIVEIGISSGEVQYVNTIYPGSGFSELGTVFTINSYGTYSTGSGFEIMVNGFESGNWNTAIGHSSLYNNTTGKFNTTIGYQSLYSNTQGETNTALGTFTLYLNTTGNYNTALGTSTLYNNTTGNDNTAIGYQSLYNNTIGGYNTAIGNQSLYNNKGVQNTALGWASLQGNTTGNYNTAIGPGSLGNNQTGSYNIGIGSQAGVYRVSFLGATNSNNSIFIGSDTTSGATNSDVTSNQIVIGHGAGGNGSNTVTLGNNSIVTTYLKGKLQLPTTPTTSAGTYSILTRNDITGEVEKIVVTPYKVYTALLTQSGTASPTAIVLENTLGVTITFSYVGVGQYTLTATGALTVNKTWVIFNNVDSNAGTVAYNVKSLNEFDILTRTLGGVTTNGILNLTEIEIRVYN